MLWIRRKTSEPTGPECFYGVKHNRLYRIPIMWAIEWAQGAKLRNEPSGLRDAITAWAGQVEREERKAMSQKEKEDQMLSLVRIAAQGERVVDAFDQPVVDGLEDMIEGLRELLRLHNDRFGDGG